MDTSKFLIHLEIAQINLKLYIELKISNNSQYEGLKFNSIIFKP